MMDWELEQARECYFAAGGVESDIGPRDNAKWYWRRAAKHWRDKRETKVERLLDVAKAAALMPCWLDYRTGATGVSVCTEKWPDSHRQWCFSCLARAALEGK